MNDPGPRNEPRMIQRLLEATPYSHPVQGIALRETHISWVLLAGDHVYKIKKPVNFGFVDFSTLERRRHFCEEEIRLNREYAPELYLGVVPITGSNDRPIIGGSGSAIEYAVHMRRFDESQMLSNLLATGRLQGTDIDDLANVVAAAHEHASVAPPESVWGEPDEVLQPAEENFDVMLPLIHEPERVAQVGLLQDWTRTTSARLRTAFALRKADGRVRECHGDLHLGNVVRWQGRVTPFDRIEFNPHFRWIDTANEIAFMAMDLRDRGRPDLSHRFVNAWLERTGDYEALRVLPFYIVYRAAVRAKVGLLRLQQATLNPAEQSHLTREWHHYLDLATATTHPAAPSLSITHGLSGSGKTYGTQRLVEKWGAVRIRSDVERKRTLGTAGQNAGIAAGLYGAETTGRVYDLLSKIAGEVIESGFPVIVDATFLKRQQRHLFQTLAEQLKVPFRILHFEADRETLAARIQQRRTAGKDVSDATTDVLDWQLATQEPLTEGEMAFVVSGSDPGGIQ